MERTGYFQGHQGYQAHQENAPRRRFKASSEIRLWKHLLLIWVGGIVFWPTLIAVLSYSTLPNAEAFVLTFLTIALNIFTGWIPAILIWLFNKGIRGWIEAGRMARGVYTEAKTFEHDAPLADEEYQAPTPVDAPVLTEEQVAAQWATMNPYGCCMDHRDAQGYPSHGGPACEHPEVRS